MAYRLGTKEHATAVLSVITNANFSSAVRAEALSALRDWSNPPARDRVTGFWKPLPKRDPKIVREVVERGFQELLAKTNGKLQADSISLMVSLGVKADEAEFVRLATDAKQEPNLRVAALRFLADRKSKQLDATIAIALKDRSPVLRAAARDTLAKTNPAEGFKSIENVLNQEVGDVAEKQSALATLATLKLPEAGKLVDDWAKQLSEGKVVAELQLDVLELLSAAKSPTRDAAKKNFEATLPKDSQGKFHVSLMGGNAEKGREIFFNHATAQCVRCHKVNDVGGVAGPDLSKLAMRNPEKTREYILESIVLPNAKIAQGFASVTFTLIDGRIIAGSVLKEDKMNVDVQTAEGKKVIFPVVDIEKRTVPVSLMPSAESILKPREMRDLIEYLMTMK